MKKKEKFKLILQTNEIKKGKQPSLSVAFLWKINMEFTYCFKHLEDFFGCDGYLVFLIDWMGVIVGRIRNTWNGLQDSQNSVDKEKSIDQFH